MNLDTLFLQPDQSTLSLVWRGGIDLSALPNTYSGTISIRTFSQHN